MEERAHMRPKGAAFSSYGAAQTERLVEKTAAEVAEQGAGGLAERSPLHHLVIVAALVVVAAAALLSNHLLGATVKLAEAVL